MADGNRAALNAWWVRCHLVAIDGSRWDGILLEQGQTLDQGAWVVIDDRRSAADAIREQGDQLWVVSNDGDRMVSASRLDFVTLETVQ